MPKILPLAVPSMVSQTVPSLYVYGTHCLLMQLLPEQAPGSDMHRLQGSAAHCISSAEVDRAGC
jgi:hypothetical protein